MKIGGVDPSLLPSEEVLVLPRGDTQIIFRARGLRDMSEFDKLCPEPKAPTKQTKDGIVPNLADRNYKSIMEEYARRRVSYMVIKSLEPSDIVWETVDLASPGTWANWETDLKDAGLMQMECNRVLQLCWEANCLDEGKLKRAREAFQLGLLVVSQESPSLSTEQEPSPSGEPVSG